MAAIDQFLRIGQQIVRLNLDIWPVATAVLLNLVAAVSVSVRRAGVPYRPVAYLIALYMLPFAIVYSAILMNGSENWVSGMLGVLVVHSGAVLGFAWWARGARWLAIALGMGSLMLTAEAIFVAGLSLGVTTGM
jgi:hypothetical protein